MFDFSSYHYANGEPSLSGVIRTQPSDFKVDEKFAFEATGEGEHALLHIKKEDTNTDWLSRQISQLAGVRKVDVSYAGLKDRNAITTQWFSVWLPGKPDPDWSLLNSDNVEILKTIRHNRKLRRGSLRGNQFTLIVRDVNGDDSDLGQRMNTICKMVFPIILAINVLVLMGEILKKQKSCLVANEKKIDLNVLSIYPLPALPFLMTCYLKELK